MSVDPTIRKPDHSTAGHVWTIWKPNLYSIWMPHCNNKGWRARLIFEQSHKKFLSSLFLCRNLWSDHFRSSSRYLCSGSRIKQKQREKMSEPNSFESSPDPEKNKSFHCSLCRESFIKAESLQDHYTGVEHARMMSRSTAGTTRPKDWGLYSQWNC